MDKAQDGIWIVDAFAQTSYASSRMAEMLGTTPAEMLGQPSFNYVFPEDAELAKRLFDSKKGGSANAFQFRLRRKDGTALRVAVQATPMFSASGAFRGIIGIFSVL